MEIKKIKISEFLIQCAATLCVSFLGCHCGFITSWASHNIPLFRSNDTVLSAPMTSIHVSLLGSLANLGGFLVTPFCGYAFNTYGRKYATVLFGLPFVLAWAIISVTDNVYLILVAMALSGAGMGGQSVTGIFLSEIAHDSIRGGLTASPNSGYFLGLLISNAMGGRMAYMQVAITFLTLSVLAVVLLMLLRESPIYLVLKGRDKEAAKSISFYRRLNVNSKEVEAEISIIKQQLDSRLKITKDLNYYEETTKELITAKEVPQQTKNISSWKFLKNSKSSQRALLVVVTTMFLTSLMGPIALQVYAESIFAEAMPSMDPNHCAVIMAIIFFVSSVVCILAVDRCGRRFLLVSTSSVCAVASLLLAILLQLHLAPDWAIAVLVYVFCFSYTTGSATTPAVLMAEVFLPEVRSLCNAIVMGTFWATGFVGLLLVPPVLETLGVAALFFVFSAVCAFVAAYSRLSVPETKGLPVHHIQLLF